MAKNIYDNIIILTIISVIFAGKIFGAFVPIKIIGCVASVYFLFFFSKLKVIFLRRNRRVISFLGLFLFQSCDKTSRQKNKEGAEYQIMTVEQGNCILKNEYSAALYGRDCRKKNKTL